MILILLALSQILGACSSGHEQIWKESRDELAAYRAELDSMRIEFRVFDMPDVSFFLFGMGNREKFLYKDSYMSGTVDAKDKNDYYPYLGWAADHFHGLKRNPVSNRDYPLTWEIRASQANYEGMRIIDSQYTVQRNATPHTWHAAEIFLYLMESIR